MYVKKGMRERILMRRSGLQGIDIDPFFLHHPDPFLLSQNLKMSDGFGDT
jgi:hypothetical protein